MRTTKKVGNSMSSKPNEVVAEQRQSPWPENVRACQWLPLNAEGRPQPVSKFEQGILYVEPTGMLRFFYIDENEEQVVVKVPAAQFGKNEEFRELLDKLKNATEDNPFSKEDSARFLAIVSSFISESKQRKVNPIGFQSDLQLREFVKRKDEVGTPDRKDVEKRQADTRSNLEEMVTKPAIEAAAWPNGLLGSELSVDGKPHQIGERTIRQYHSLRKKEGEFPKENTLHALEDNIEDDNPETYIQSIGRNLSKAKRSQVSRPVAHIAEQLVDMHRTKKIDETILRELREENESLLAGEKTRKQGEDFQLDAISQLSDIQGLLRSFQELKELQKELFDEKKLPDLDKLEKEILVALSEEAERLVNFKQLCCIHHENDDLKSLQESIKEQRDDILILEELLRVLPEVDAPTVALKEYLQKIRESLSQNEAALERRIEKNLKKISALEARIQEQKEDIKALEQERREIDPDIIRKEKAIDSELVAMQGIISANEFVILDNAIRDRKLNSLDPETLGQIKEKLALLREMHREFNDKVRPEFGNEALQWPSFASSIDNLDKLIDMVNMVNLAELIATIRAADPSVSLVALSNVDQMLEELLAVKSADGKTALHYAVIAGNSDMVKLLIEQGALINAIDSNGKTALHYAAEKDDTKIFYALLYNQNTDPSPEDKKGKTPLDYAGIAVRKMESRRVLTHRLNELFSLENELDLKDKIFKQAKGEFTQFLLNMNDSKTSEAQRQQDWLKLCLEISSKLTYSSSEYRNMLENSEKYSEKELREIEICYCAALFLEGLLKALEIRTSDGFKATPEYQFLINSIEIKRQLKEAERNQYQSEESLRQLNQAMSAFDEAARALNPVDRREVYDAANQQLETILNPKAGAEEIVHKSSEKFQQFKQKMESKGTAKKHIFAALKGVAGAAMVVAGGLMTLSLVLSFPGSFLIDQGKKLLKESKQEYNEASSAAAMQKPVAELCAQTAGHLVQEPVELIVSSPVDGCSDRVRILFTTTINQTPVLVSESMILNDKEYDTEEDIEEGRELSIDLRDYQSEDEENRSSQEAASSRKKRTTSVDLDGYHTEEEREYAYGAGILDDDPIIDLSTYEELKLQAPVLPDELTPALKKESVVTPVGASESTLQQPSTVNPTVAVALDSARRIVANQLAQSSPPRRPRSESTTYRAGNTSTLFACRVQENKVVPKNGNGFTPSA